MKRLVKASFVIFFCILMSVCAYASTYDVFVGGRQLSEENAADVFEDGGSVVFDASQSTLHLYNANVEGSYQFDAADHEAPNGHTAAIYAQQFIRIVVHGDCYITSGTENSHTDYAVYIDCSNTVPNIYVGLRIEGENDGDSLTITSNASYDNAAVYVNNGIVEIRDVDIFATANNTQHSSHGIRITDEDSKLYLYRSDIHVKSGDVVNSIGEASSYALSVGNLEVNESSITAMSGSAQGVGEAVSCGVYVDRTLMVTQSGTVDASSDSAYALDGECSSFGVAADSITIEGTSHVSGKSNEVSSTSSSKSYGIYAVSDFSFSNFGGSAAAVTVAEAENASVGAIYVGSKINNGKVVDIESGNRLSYNSETMTYETDANIASNAVVINAEIITIGDYNLAVGGIEVTAENKDDIFGDADEGVTASYDETTNTLTLVNANITEAYCVTEGMTAAIYTLVPLNIVVSGNNTIKTGTTNAVFEAGIAYYGPEIADGNAIAISGSSKDDVLNITTSNTDTVFEYEDGSRVHNTNAIIASTSGNIIAKDVSVNGFGGHSLYSAYGVVAGMSNDSFGDIIVDGAKVEIALGDIHNEESMDGVDIQNVGAVAMNLEIVNNGELVIDCGDITVGGIGTSVGVQIMGSINVSGESSLYSASGNITNSNNDLSISSISAGIFALNSDVAISVNGNSSVVGVGGNVVGSNLYNDGSLGVLSIGKIVVDGGSTVIGESGEVPGGSMGVSGSEIVVTDGTVRGTTTANDAVSKIGIACNSKIENVIVYDDNGVELVYNGTDGYVYREGNCSTSTNVVNGEWFDLWVGGVRVTTVVMDDILGDGTVSYNPETNTLTLNNAKINNYSKHSEFNCGIYSDGDLNVVLLGDNSIDVFPDESDLDEFAIAVKCNGDITVTSEETATLDINVGTATRENFGFYIDGSLTASGKVAFDISLGDIEITHEFSNVNDTFGNSIGIHCSNSAYFRDDVSVKCETGNIFVPEGLGFEGTLEDINSGGTTVGIAVYGNLIFDTTGELYFYVNDSDGKRAGVASFSNFELKQGNIVVEMSESKGKYLVAGAAVYVTTDGSCPCIPLCGPDDSSLETGTIKSQNMAGYPLNVYADKNGELATYTKIVASVVGMPEVESDTLGKTNVFVKAEDEEKVRNALIVFASYNENGKMLDVKFEYGAYGVVDGKISSDLDLTGAVKVTVFVFENNGSFQPLSPELTTTDITKAA